MTLPALIFGILIALFIGSLFHLWRGGGIGRLFLYLFLSLGGFWGGHFIAAHYDWHLWDFGPLRLGFALIGAFLILGIGYWLSLVKIQETLH